MIITALLNLILWVLNLITSLFRGLIPNFGSGITNILSNIATMLDGGINFLAYFLNMDLVFIIITCVISYYGFLVIKQAVMLILGKLFKSF